MGPDAVRRVTTWLPVVLWMALIFWFSSLREPRFADVPVIDLVVKKAGHLCLYLVLAFVLALGLGRSLSGTRWERHTGRIALTIAIVFAAFDELHQAFTPTRDPSIVDVGIDATGAVVGVLAWRVLVRLRADRLDPH